MGGSWDFGVAKLQMHYSRTEVGARNGKGYLVGALVPVGSDVIKLALSRHETDAAGNPTGRKIAVGYVDNFSKRTAVYGTYAIVHNSGGAATALNGAVTAPDTTAKGADIGIRHSF